MSAVLRFFLFAPLLLLRLRKTVAAASFEYELIGAVTDASSVVTIDFDGDGDLDILSASSSLGSIYWHENDGSRSFTTHTISDQLPSTTTVFAIDVDGDGDIDALSASGSTSKIAWYENDGSEKFTEHVIGTSMTAVSALAADFDQDGNIDFITGSADTGAISWWQNNGSQTFTEKPFSVSHVNLLTMRINDLDQDGDMDLITVGGTDLIFYQNIISSAVSIDFNRRLISISVNGPKSFDITDLNSDGFKDIIIATANRVSPISWFSNNGFQTFTENVLSTTNRFDAGLPDQIFGVDIDGDNDIDILSGSIPGNSVAWFENSGSLFFAENILSTSTDDTAGVSAILAADVDGDSNLDIVFAAATSNKIGWFDNLAAAAPTMKPSPGPPTSAKPTAAKPTTLPTTAMPTLEPTTAVPTLAPTTAVPSFAPTTSMPTTDAPSFSPTTAAPSGAPTTSMPTTAAPTVAPTTTMPTTAAPTAVPTTAAPTVAPTTSMPTTAAPTAVPTTGAPTIAPTTSVPTTAAPSVSPTTSMPTTAAPSFAPTTSMPTTAAPTFNPTSAAPTLRPTAPTFSPSFRPSDALRATVDSTLTLSGIEDPELTAAEKAAIAGASCDVMDLDRSLCEFIGTSDVVDNDPIARRRLLFSLKAIIRILLNLSGVSESAESLAKSLKRKLNAAVTADTFSTTLRDVAAELDVTSLDSTSVDAVALSDATVLGDDDGDDDNNKKKSDSDGGLSRTEVAVLIFFLLLAAILIVVGVFFLIRCSAAKHASDATPRGNNGIAMTPVPQEDGQESNNI